MQPAKNTKTHNNENPYYENEPYIRPPDKITKIQMIGDETCDETTKYNQSKEEHDLEEHELEEALRASCELAEKYDNEQMEMYMNKINERNEEFRNINFIFKRISTFDKEVAYIYNIVYYAINNYVTENLQSFVLDKDVYEDTFRVIKRMRFNEKEHCLLKSIMKSNETETIDPDH